MSDINTVDLRGFVSGAMNEVFDTMLSMDIELADEGVHGNVDGERIVGSVGFAGKAVGSVSVQVNEAFARSITAAMLGMEEDEIDGDEEVHDVIGELSNMVGGDLKSRLCDEGLNCNLSIPSITTGSDFKTETKGWERHESLIFRHQEQFALVDVYVKTNG
jgi:CheY-specific phosphatase CheX